MGDVPDLPLSPLGAGTPAAAKSAAKAAAKAQFRECPAGLSLLTPPSPGWPSVTQAEPHDMQPPSPTRQAWGTPRQQAEGLEEE